MEKVTILSGYARDTEVTLSLPERLHIQHFTFSQNTLQKQRPLKIMSFQTHPERGAHEHSTRNSMVSQSLQKIQLYLRHRQVCLE